MALPIKLDGLLVKIEAEYGTDPTPTTAANGVRIADRLWPTLRIEHVWPNLRDGTASGNIGPAAPALPAGAMATIEVPIELKGAGAAYAAGTRPEMDPLLRSVGFDDTVVTTGGSESITYALVSTGHESCTMWCYAANKLYKVSGCRGSMRWVATPGQSATVIFSMSGIMAAAVPTEVALPTITYSAQLPPPAIGMSHTIGSWSPVFQSAEFNLGTQVQQQQSGNATDGIAAFQISAFEPRFTETAETVALTTFDPTTVLEAHTATNIDWTIGSSQYNRAKLDINSAWLVNDPSPENFNDFTAYGLEFGMAMSNVSIIFD